MSAQLCAPARTDPFAPLPEQFTGREMPEAALAGAGAGAAAGQDAPAEPPTAPGDAGKIERAALAVFGADDDDDDDE